MNNTQQLAPGMVHYSRRNVVVKGKKVMVSTGDRWRLYLQSKISYAHLPKAIKEQVDYVCLMEGRKTDNIVLIRSSWHRYFVVDSGAKTYFDLDLRTMVVD